MCSSLMPLATSAQMANIASQVSHVYPLYVVVAWDHITSTNASLPGNSTGDFFLPAFQCPHKVQRVGTLGDGGKWVCGLEKVAEKRKPCVIYSVGTQRTA